MYSLVVFASVLLVAAAAPSPGLLGGYAIPAATSYQSRVDIHSKPIVTYTAPVVAKTVVAAPLSYGLDHVDYDYHTSPLVSGYSLGHDYGVNYGYGLGHHGYGYGHGW